MKEALKEIACDPMCGFMIRSHDEKEVVGIATSHAKNAHQMDVSEKDMREKVKMV